MDAHPSFSISLFCADTSHSLFGRTFDVHYLEGGEFLATLSITRQKVSPAGTGKIDFLVSHSLTGGLRSRISVL